MVTATEAQERGNSCRGLSDFSKKRWSCLTQSDRDPSENRRIWSRLRQSIDWIDYIKLPPDDRSFDDAFPSSRVVYIEDSLHEAAGPTAMNTF